MEPRTGPAMAAILFTDIEGSSRLWEVARAEMDRVLAEHDRRIRQIVRERNGSIFAAVGDGFGVAFETVTCAVDAAQCISQAVDDLAVAGEPLRVRMGIHVGEVAQRDGDVFGPTVNRSARIMDLAWGGQIVVSDAAARLLGGDTGLVDLGVYVLKGLSEPERVRQVGSAVHPPLRSGKSTSVRDPQLVGRTQTVSRIIEAAESTRLVSVVGPVGVGKTAVLRSVASELARRGIPSIFVEAAHLDDPEEILLDIASQAVGGGRIHGGALAAIDAALTGTPTVVIVDGCEDRCPGMTSALERLMSGTSVSLIAGGRWAFGFPSESVVRIEPLAIPDPDDPVVELEKTAGVELLRRAARRHGVETEAADTRDLARIVGAVGGLPLALELAASKLAVLSARQLASQLESDGSALLGERLASVIDDALAEIDLRPRQMFECLAVCRGSFSLEAAAAVIGRSEGETVELLSHLVEHSVMSACSTGGVRRYAIHEPIRRSLLAGVDPAQARRRHAMYHLELARRGKHLTNDDEAAGLALIDAEYQQCLDALQWCVEGEELAIGLELASSLRWYWWSRGYSPVVTSWLQRLLNGDRARVPPEILAEGLQTAGTLAYRDDVVTARRLFDDSLQVFGSILDAGNQDPGVRFAYTRALLSSGAAAAADGDWSMAAVLFSDARHHAARAGDGQTAGIALMNMTHVLLSEGDLEKAAAVADEASDLLRQAGTPSRRAEALEICGEVALRRGRLDEAIEYLELARDIARHNGYLPSFHETSAHLSEAYLLAGRPSDAAATVREILQVGASPSRGVVQALAVAARLAAEGGDAAAAFLLAGVASTAVGQLGDETTVSTVERILSTLEGRSEPRAREREADGRALPLPTAIHMVLDRIKAPVPSQ